MFSSLLYNINVATSITSQGRAAVSSMTLCFESFLANNVKFGSLNEVLEFIDHIVNEKHERKFDDRVILDNPYTKIEDVFAKMVLSCGYRWIPNDKELDILWRVLNNLSTEDLNRVYYKNNLYEFISNKKIEDLVLNIARKLKRPLLNSLDIPEEIEEDINFLAELVMEYVYYHYLYIDRIDRCDQMIKSVTMVSDTDSTIISLDAWYRYFVEKLNGEELRIANYCPNPVLFVKKNEDGEWETTDWLDAVEFEPKKLDYNFATDEIVERERTNDPSSLTPNDNVRFSLINILAFILDRIVNDYMERFCTNNHSFNKLSSNPRKCRIIAKNEFLFSRLMMTMVKKNYASLIAVQEGNIVPEEKQLDVKGIEVMYKSSSPKSTRDALKKIVLEDILKAPVIDQMRFIKDICILEKQIINNINSGSKDYYKPATIKAATSYADPMRIQGIKASVAWNLIKDEESPAINLDERNGINIAKVVINKQSAEEIKDSYPEIYNNINSALAKEEFKGKIDAIAIPMDVDVPEWLFKFINTNQIISDNISGFPYESIGIQTLDKKNVAYSNILQL